MFIVRLMVQDLADLYANDTFDDPTLHLAPTLIGPSGRISGGEAEKVIDVTGYRDGYQVHTMTAAGGRGNEFYMQDGEDFFVTMNETVRALALD